MPANPIFPRAALGGVEPSSEAIHEAMLAIAEYRDVDAQSMGWLFHDQESARDAVRLARRFDAFRAATTQADGGQLVPVKGGFATRRSLIAAPQQLDREAVPLDAVDALLDHIDEVIVPELIELRPGGSMQTGLAAMSKFARKQVAALVYTPPALDRAALLKWLESRYEDPDCDSKKAAGFIDVHDEIESGRFAAAAPTQAREREGEKAELERLRRIEGHALNVACGLKGKLAKKAMRLLREALNEQPAASKDSR